MPLLRLLDVHDGVHDALPHGAQGLAVDALGEDVCVQHHLAQGGTLHATHEAEGAEVAVVDTPGALQEALSDWLKEANVVVIPTRTTSRDIEPLMRMRKAVFKHSRAKIVYVMNGWNRFKASRDFMEWFEGLAGDQTVVTLPQSEAFVQAGAAGVSVVEFDRRGKAARATRAMVDTVREAAGFPRE